MYRTFRLYRSGFCLVLFVLAQVEYHVQIGLQTHKNNQYTDRRAQSHRQECTEQNGQMHNNNSSVRAAHQLVEFDLGILTLNQVVVDKRDAVT